MSHPNDFARKRKSKFSLLLIAMLVLSLALFSACGKKTANGGESASESVANSQTGESSQTASNANSQASQNSVNSVGSAGANSESHGASQSPQNSQSSPSGGTTPSYPENYSERISAYLDGATIGDNAFINYIKSLGDYDNAKKSADNAVIVAPNGTDEGDGTVESPIDLQSAFDNAQPGQTIFLRGGTYSASINDGYYLNTKGNANAYITVRPYGDEKVKITNTTSGKELYGLFVDAAAYTVVEGIEIGDIAAYNAYGIASWASGSHIIIRNCFIHDIKTTAADPQRDTNSGSNAILFYAEDAVDNIAVMNNECSGCVTGWCEVVSFTGNCEYAYALANKVHDNTNIGIDFYGNAGYCSTPALDQPRYCVAAGNVIYNNICGYADCAGLYVDGARDIILQFNEIYDCAYGIEVGSEEKNDSYPVKNILVRSNLCHDNNVTGIRVGGYEKNSTGVVRDTVILNNTLVNNGESQVIISKVDGITFKNNLLQSSIGSSPFTTEFGTAYTKNLSFVNNIVFVRGMTATDVEFYTESGSITGITAFDATYGGKTTFAEVTLGSDYSLTAASPAIDAGAADSSLGNFDFTLHARTVGTAPDVGAFEFKN